MTVLSLRRNVLRVLLSFILFFTAAFPSPALAAVSWPDTVSVSAEGAVLMDADSGCVIYGKNLHQRYYPASITKILTALIVIEHCDLDDTLTFSYDAVHNVEPGSTSAGYDTGDQITVRQALYAMLLKSANEVANALAEHCAGSIEAFARMMNEKAASLGCTDSSFANPSGLNHPDHYTTPYDFALIAQAAFANPTFVEFDSTTYYELPPNSTNPEPFMVYCGHKMLKKNSGHYYPGIIGGKTGYTLLAGNTLVTCAERDGLKLISVIMNGHKTHYDDTKALLDFGFSNFKNEAIRTDSAASLLNPEENLNLSGTQQPLLTLDTTRSVTLPKKAALSDIRAELSYDLQKEEPSNTVALVRFFLGDRLVGTSRLSADSSVEVQPEGSRPVHIGLLRRIRALGKQLQNGALGLHFSPFFLVPAILLIAAGIVWILIRRLRIKQKKETLRLSRQLQQSLRNERILHSDPWSEQNDGISSDHSLSGSALRTPRDPSTRRRSRRRGS